MNYETANIIVKELIEAQLLKERDRNMSIDLLMNIDTENEIKNLKNILDK